MDLGAGFSELNLSPHRFLTVFMFRLHSVDLFTGYVMSCLNNSSPLYFPFAIGLSYK